MTKPDDTLATIIFAAAIGCAVAVAITSDITAPICKAAAKAQPLDKFDFGCFEFWFNRYQGLLGNLVTAAVAGLTLIWVARQLGAADRQVAVAAAQALRTVVKEHEMDRADLKNIRDDIMVLRERYDREQYNERKIIYSQFDDLVARAKIIDNAIPNLIAKIAPVRSRNSDAELDQILHKLTIGLTRTIVDANRVFALREQVRSAETDEESFRLLDVAKGILNNAGAGLVANINVCGQAISTAQFNVDQTWKTIRTFERSAIAGGK